jgi:hypothetical protein
MKTNIFRTSSILAGLVLLVAVSLSSTAQQTPRTQQQVQEQVQQKEVQLPELAVQEIDSEVLRVRVPRECERIRPDVQMHDVADNFNPPGNPVSLSPALANYLQSHQITPKGYDDKRVNTVFADSFKIRSCKVCYATLEVGVRHYQDLWQNDTITVGGAPFSPAFNRILSRPIWTPPLPNPLNLPAPAMNQYIFNNSSSFLDIVAQDDTDFDFARLSVWYY